MQMQKTSRRLLQQSIVLMDIMSGEDKMYYLQRMWELYIDVYVRTPSKFAKKRKKTIPMDRKKAYDLCSELTKIFGH